jgi:hypothetical protein
MDVHNNLPLVMLHWHGGDDMHNAGVFRRRKE